MPRPQRDLSNRENGWQRPTPLQGRGVIALLALCLCLLALPASAIETSAREAILVDAETGTVLLEKDADVSMPPASMSKVMTVYLVFERLKDGRLSLDDTLEVSEKAWRKGGSKMFVEVGNQVRVEDLLRGVIVQSGNDACIVLAEGIAGTESAFAELMTQKAEELGMTGSHFTNSTGWPDPNHRMTARDLATLAEAMIEQFPEYYHYYSETEFTWNEIRQFNRNPLLGRVAGADGLKTGHTEEAGYGLTASAERDGRRLVLVVNGLDSVRARAEESARLMEWGFREFDNYRLFAAEDTVERAEVWLGAANYVPLVTDGGLTMTLPKHARSEMTVKVVYDGPIPAPIEEGQEIARLEIDAPGMDVKTFPLYAGTSVEKLGPFGRLIGSIEHMIFGSASALTEPAKE
jgi:D-alanyl-D-alanine carboxypeptidase (penicillin-binding protein 5/6)